MPARDTYHHEFRRALEKAGWTITDDPLRLAYRTRDMYVDLAAERYLAAEKGQQKIAVEIQSFVGKAGVHELGEAAGQFLLYDRVMQRLKSDRVLYMAIRQSTYNNLFADSLGEVLLDDLRLIVFDEVAEELTLWMPEMPTAS